MNSIQIYGILAILIFYIVYLAKSYSLKKHDIQVNCLAKGEKSANVRRLEFTLACVSYLMPIIQVASIFFIDSYNTIFSLQILGLIIAYIGIIFFSLAVYAMRKNWRAGIDASQKTELVESGIYKLSRNPVFVGFDLFYIGIALCFANSFIVIYSIAALTLFHIQILAEEKYLLSIFKDQYLAYQQRTKRYLFF